MRAQCLLLCTGSNSLDTAVKREVKHHLEQQHGLVIVQERLLDRGVGAEFAQVVAVTR